MSLQAHDEASGSGNGSGGEASGNESDANQFE